MHNLYSRVVAQLRSLAFSRSTRLALERRRLLRMPRHESGATIYPFGIELTFPDAASYLAMAGDICEREVYRFEATHPDPNIIDAGANVGISVAYFKSIYPRAQIVAYEADPVIFRYLEANIKSLGFRDVRLENVAVATVDGETLFHREGSDAGRIAKPKDPSPIAVPTRRLRNAISGPVDLLKLDVEGAETEILCDCAGVLHWVSNIFVEYHGFADEPQRLPELLSLLRDCGFRYWIDAAVKQEHPLCGVQAYLGMDLQLNVFARRV